MTARALPGPLVSTEWLAAHLGEADVKIVDASWRLDPAARPARDDYRRRHIPSAVFFDIDAVADHDTDLPHMLPSADEFARAVGALGIGAFDRVIVYDDAGLFSAARVWWTFRAMGHAAVSVLDGGLPRWIAEGRPTEVGDPHLEPADYRPSTPGAIAASADDVRAPLRDGAPRILDARAHDRFEGRAPEPRAGLRGGAMPGAVNLPLAALLDADGALAAPAALKAAFEARGVGPDDHVIATCGSGVTAAVIVLALERLGWRSAGLYDGAWAEWARDYGAARNETDFPVVAAADAERDAPSV